MTSAGSASHNGTVVNGGALTKNGVAISDAAGRPAPDVSRARRWLLAAGAPAITGLEALAQGPLWQHFALLAAVNLATCATFVVTGILLRGEPGQRGTSWALILAGVARPLGWLNQWETGPLPLYATVFGYLDDIFGAWALLRYPAPRLGRYRRAFLAALASWLIGGPAVLAVVSRPQWRQFSSAVWWPGWLADRTAYHTGSLVFLAGALALALAFVGLLIVRLTGARGLDRLLITPVFAAAIIATLVEVTVLARSQLSTAGDDLFTFEGLAELMVPLAFLISVLQRSVARAGVADLAVRLAGPGRPVTVREELRRVFRDPGLDLCYWAPAAKRYEDDSGTAADLAELGAGRMIIPVTGSDGRTPLAIILADPSVRRDQLLLEGAVSASAMALENERLQADLRARLAETSASRARIAEAGFAERRRIERNLHDGAQQRLLGLAARLSAARARTTDPAVISALDHAGAELRQALSELRDLARGILPAILGQSGIGPAIEGVVERLPIRVSLDVTARRYRPGVEGTAYLVLCEALTNTVKHSACRAAEVHVWEEDEMLVVQARDKGCGGADPAAAGLSALADRVRALGGDIAIDSPPGFGTCLTARIPCE
jgi:signal transduction histidine kinase